MGGVKVTFPTILYSVCTWNNFFLDGFIGTEIRALVKEKMMSSSGVNLCVRVLHFWKISNVTADFTCAMNLSNWISDIAGVVLRKGLHNRSNSLTICLTNILSANNPVGLWRIVASMYLILFLPLFLTILIVALNPWVVLKSLVVGNFLAKYTVEVTRLAAVVEESFLTDRIVGLKVVRIREFLRRLLRFKFCQPQWGVLAEVWVLIFSLWLLGFFPRSIFSRTTASTASMVMVGGGSETSWYYWHRLG